MAVAFLSTVVALGSLPVLADLGVALGTLWLIYGMTLLLATALGITLAVLAFVGWLATRDRSPGRVMRAVTLPLEVVFCLINPAAYLLILVRSSADTDFFVDVRSTWLDPLAWLALAGLWTLRLVPIDDERRRRWARGAVAAGLTLLAVYLTKDCVAFAAQPPSPIWDPDRLSMFAVYLPGVFALYLIPAAILARHLASTGTPERWREPHGFVLLPRRLGGAVVFALASLAAISAVLFAWRPNDAASERLVLAHRAAILRAADATGADPQLVAALVYVLQRQISPFGTALETSLTEAALVDATTGTMLSDGLDLSIGLAQIKPRTAQAALLLLDADPDAPLPFGSYNYKEYRGVSRLADRWPNRPAVVDLRELRVPWLPGKREVVGGLRDDERAIEMCAVIIELYARQWEHANPSWSIRDRPEILASLYQLGFERSHPKADPRSIPFGDAVRAAMPRFASLGGHATVRDVPPCGIAPTRQRRAPRAERECARSAQLGSVALDGWPGNGEL